jgi:hemerythrin-like domain-containing protein
MLIPNIRRAPAERPEHPIDLLLACHGRIRSFCATAARILDPGAASDAQVADAARAVHRYFTVAMPLHVEDEDHSIARRAAALVRPREVELALAAMDADHREVDARIARMAPSWRALFEGDGDAEVHVQILVADTEVLSTTLLRHVAMEEEILFPWLRAALPREAWGEIFAEMRARRASSFTPERSA